MHDALCDLPLLTPTAYSSLGRLATHFRILQYSGDADPCVPYVGAARWIVCVAGFQPASLLTADLTRLMKAYRASNLVLTGEPRPARDLALEVPTQGLKP